MVVLCNVTAALVKTSIQKQSLGMLIHFTSEIQTCTMDSMVFTFYCLQEDDRRNHKTGFKERVDFVFFVTKD